MAALLVLVVAALVGIDMIARHRKRAPPPETAITTQKIVVDLSRRR